MTVTALRPRSAPTRPAVHLFATMPSVLTLRDTGTVVVRGARPDDLDELVALHARCSPADRFRFHGDEYAVHDRARLRELLAADLCLLGLRRSGAAVALGTLVSPDPPTHDGHAEVGVLVADDWRGRGLGTGLLRHVVAGARLEGHHRVYGRVQVGPDGPGLDWLGRALTQLGPTRRVLSPFGEQRVVLEVAPHHVGGLAPPAVPPQRRSA